MAGRTVLIGGLFASFTFRDKVKHNLADWHTVTPAPDFGTRLRTNFSAESDGRILSIIWTQSWSTGDSGDRAERLTDTEECLGLR
jgi:hypothetical protein